MLNQIFTNFDEIFQSKMSLLLVVNAFFPTKSTCNSSKIIQSLTVTLNVLRILHYEDVDVFVSLCHGQRAQKYVELGTLTVASMPKTNY